MRIANSCKATWSFFASGEGEVVILYTNFWKNKAWNFVYALKEESWWSTDVTKDYETLKLWPDLLMGSYTHIYFYDLEGGIESPLVTEILSSEVIYWWSCKLDARSLFTSSVTFTDILLKLLSFIEKFIAWKVK